MSSIVSPAPRHGTHRASHLRQVSNSGSDTPSNSRPGTAVSEAGTVQHDSISLRLFVEKKCVLWVHDEAFSKDEIVLNLGLFPEIKEGDVLSIAGITLETSVRDFQDRSKGSMHESDTLSAGGQRERSSSNPRSPVSAGPNDSKGGDEEGKRYLFIARDMSNEMKSKAPNLEISVAKHIADAFGFKHRSNCLLSAADLDTCSASHVQMAFRDEYLARSDMWRLTVRELSNKTVYKGQKILFMGTIKVQVTAVYVEGRKVQSAFFSTNTRPIFRSESARYVLYVQMSREMWDFDSEGSGEIMFNKVVNGFLPALFKKWAALKAKHLVSIVLFTRVEYDMGIASDLISTRYDTEYYTGIQANGSKKPYKDFYRVVVSEMASGSWTTILYQLKREFKFFRRDVSLHRINITKDTNLKSSTTEGTLIEAQPSLAMHGNVLEAINLASSQFAHDYIDRDLTRTGISVVVITPCAGLFEVDYETLRMTTENLTGNGIGIDLVCLPKIPLHSVPLFRYRNPEFDTFREALQFRALRSEDSTPRQNPAVFGTSFSSLAESLSPSKASQPGRSSRMGSMASAVPPSEWSYAIPHWVDVSFWTGASQDKASSKPSTHVKSRYLRHWNAGKSSDFAIRCKMYEMEMASVMESAMTEISITPLQHESFFPMMITGPRDLPASSKKPEKLGLIKRPKPYAGFQEFVGGPSKPLVDRHSSEDLKRILRVLEAFDLARSQVDDNPRVGRNVDGSKYFKPGSEEAAKRLLAEDPKLFGTSFTDDQGTVKGATLMSTSYSNRVKHESQAVEELPRPRKPSMSSMTVNSKGSPIRPTRFSRQISLGKHGFNLAAPKAAIAAIQTENASATVPALNSSSGEQKKKSGTPSHLFGNSATSTIRPSSSQSELSKKSEKSDSKSVVEDVAKTPSKPMTIKSALQSLDSTNQFKSRTVLGSLYETTDTQGETEKSHTLHSARADDNQKLYNSKLLAGAVPELPATLSPTTALSPWLTVLNPSNPANTDIQSQYRRWQHVFPKRVHAKTMKWKSLCCPASVPLTTSDFPTKYQLETEYQQKPYNVSQSFDEDLIEEPKSREDFLRELIALRLTHGFQIVVGPAVGLAFGQKAMKIANAFDHEQLAEDGASVLMSLGNTIHQLSCVNETEVEVSMFIRKPTASRSSSPGSVVPTVYNPAIKTTLAADYDSRPIVLGKSKDEYNWNYVDAYIAGFDEEMSENLRFWRARYVLIPMERPTQAHRAQGEDNEEEVRLEGIKKLTQMWQRHRVPSASERKSQSMTAKKMKDPNPLDIVYKTEDPSVVVTAELETLPLLETGDSLSRRGQLIETERFRRNKLDVAALAAAIQAPLEKGGVPVQDRRWHWRMHYNCFIGLDMTTWLLENFEDIHTREEAVEFGNKLMVRDELHRISENERNVGKEKSKDIGIFVHVEGRHAFRDGQYFYQVAGEHANVRPGSRSGWFSQRRRDHSVPSTPMTENATRDSPRPSRSRSSSHHDERVSSSGTTTPTTAVFSSNNNSNGKKPKVSLSKVMKYDVDPRRRSYRPERINLHYDRLHNPDSCYHIRIDWMSVTAKLIEDAVASWAATAERYGLRLVEAPIGEAYSITTVHPFRSPYIIKVAQKPPEEPPKLYLDSNPFGPRDQHPVAGRHYYHKHIMKKFNFVLDIEAARNFPSNVDVTYSWGKPDFKYTQYIHRSGIVLAQITDDGDFLLLANRLYNNRTSAAREAERNLKTEANLMDNTRNSIRITSAIYANNFPLSDRSTPLPSPAIRPVQTNSMTHISPLLKPAGFATSDVLGPSLQNSRIALSLTPESIKKDLERFCSDGPRLEAFYNEVFEKATPPAAPTPPTFLRSQYDTNVLAGLSSDREIPSLGLPPNLFTREGNASPAKFGGGMMPFLGRRQSVQVGVGTRNELTSSSGIGSVREDRGRIGDNSPRGSVSEGEK